MDQNSTMGQMPSPQGNAAGFGPTPVGNNATQMNGTPQMNNAGAAGRPVMPMPAGAGAQMGGMPGAAPAGVPGAPAQIPNAGAPVNMPGMKAEKPAKNNAIIEIVILVVVCIVAAAAIIIAVLFFMRWNDLSSSFDANLALQVSEKEAEVRKEEEAKFAEREKEPFASFSGPSDYGSIYFEYPKTWNVYVASDGSSNTDYEAYFAASAVPPTGQQDSRYALRFIIRNQALENVQRQYDYKVQDGSITSSNYSVNGISGTLFTGMIEEEINGKIFVAKVNDKTLIMQTDSTTHFDADFTALLAKLRRG